MTYCCRVLSVYIRLITEFYSWGKEQFYFCCSLFLKTTGQMYGLDRATLFGFCFIIIFFYLLRISERFIFLLSYVFLLPPLLSVRGYVWEFVEEV